MRVLVCGGRDFNDKEYVYYALDWYAEGRKNHPITTVIHGDARGADTLAGQWATERKLLVIACPAEWDKHGRAAGSMRNLYMLTLNPRIVLAFPGGYGTEHMKRSALKQRVPVLELIHVVPMLPRV